MFCSVCGSELDVNEKFCSNCGSKNKKWSGKGEAAVTVRQANPIVARSTSTFNRDVLLKYLYALQTLEVAKHKLSDEKSKLERQIDSLGHPGHVVGRHKMTSYETWFGTLAFMVVVFLVASWIDSGLNGDGWFSVFHDLLSPVMGLVKILSALIGIASIIFAIHDYFEDKARYERETQDEEDRLISELAEKRELEKVYPLIAEDLKKTKNLLKKAYAINIVPAKYRNVHAIYFLYDNLSTSHISFDDALSLCALDEISKKLDVIIKQQREILLQQARANALNEQIIRQNEELLQHAIATERNTALAAQYSEVAAVHASTIATVQNYYYFKNM